MKYWKNYSSFILQINANTLQANHRKKITQIFGQLDPGKTPKGKPVRERAFI